MKMRLVHSGAPKLGAGETILLLRIEEEWFRVVTKIRMGVVPLQLGLRNFLVKCGHLLEVAGERNEVDSILAAAMRGHVSFARKDLTDIESTSLAIIESRWEALVEKIKGEEIDFISGVNEFTRILGKYLVCFIPKESGLLEKYRLAMQDFYRSRGFEVEVPSLPIGEEIFSDWRREGREIIYRPSEESAPTKRLMLALEHRMLLEHPDLILWDPAETGYWFLAEAQEECPRAGQGSYREFSEEADQKGEELLSLEEYVIFWHFGGAGGLIPDTGTDTMLRTHYGVSRIVHAKGSDPRHTYELLIGDWGNLNERHPLMGARFRRVVG